MDLTNQQTELYEDADWLRQLMNTLHRLRYDNIKCDACLLASDGVMTMAHSIILAAASPFLSNRLWGTVSSVPIMVDIDAKSETVKKIVDFIYSGQINASSFSTWSELLDTARLLQMPALVRLCCHHVDSGDNCLGQDLKPDPSFTYFDTKSNMLSPVHDDDMDELSPSSTDGDSVQQKTESDCFEGVTTLAGSMMPSSSESSVYTEMKDRRMSSPSIDVQCQSSPSSLNSGDDVGSPMLDHMGEERKQDGHYGVGSPILDSMNDDRKQDGHNLSESPLPTVKIARQKEGFMGDCPDCGLLLGSPEAAKLHQNIHAGRKPYTCETCSKEFDTKRSLSTHVRNSHQSGIPSQGSFPCSMCDKVLASKLGLKVHEQTHSAIKKRYECMVCSKVLTTPLGLKNHELNHSATKEMFSCRICGKVLTTKLGLKLHEINHSGFKQLYFCQYCNKKLTTKLGLQLHEEGHRNSGERHRCHLCNKIMASAPALRAHLISHNDENPGNFECQVCKALLPSKANLQAHEQMHSEAKALYQCNFCNKALSSKSSLKLHEDLHWRPDKAQFPCPVCNMVFMTRASCELHHMEHIRQANEITQALNNDNI